MFIIQKIKIKISNIQRVVAMDIAEDVYSYVLRHKEMKMQNELSKAATILSDTT